MNEMTEASDLWAAWAGEEQRYTGNAVLIGLNKSAGNDQAAVKAVQLARLLVDMPIKGAVGELELTKARALGLATMFIDRATIVLVDDPVEVSASTILDRVTGIHGSERTAALMAVRQLGGRKLGLRPWQFLALGDTQTSDGNVPDEVIETVVLAAANTAPGLEWKYVYDLGFVLYRLS